MVYCVCKTVHNFVSFRLLRHCLNICKFFSKTKSLYSCNFCSSTDITECDTANCFANHSQWSKQCRRRVSLRLIETHHYFFGDACFFTNDWDENPRVRRSSRKTASFFSSILPRGHTKLLFEHSRKVITATVP